MPEPLKVSILFEQTPHQKFDAMVQNVQTAVARRFHEAQCSVTAAAPPLRKKDVPLPDIVRKAAHGAVKAVGNDTEAIACYVSGAHISYSTASAAGKGRVTIMVAARIRRPVAVFTEVHEPEDMPLEVVVHIAQQAEKARQSLISGPAVSEDELREAMALILLVRHGLVVSAKSGR